MIDLSFFFLLNSLFSKFFVMFGSIDIGDLPYISLGFEDLKMKTHPPPPPALKELTALRVGRKRKGGRGQLKEAVSQILRYTPLHGSEISQGRQSLKNFLKRSHLLRALGQRQKSGTSIWGSVMILQSWPMDVGIGRR